MALMWAAGYADRLVHIDHSNHLGDNSANQNRQMVNNAAAAAQRFGIDPAIIFDDQTQLSEMLANFAAVGNASNAADPLWVIAAGPMETIWRGINAMQPNKRQFVKVISHGKWNEVHADTRQLKHTWDDLLSDFPEVTYIQIRDQNGTYGNPPAKDAFRTARPLWHWLRDSDYEPYQWLFSIAVGAHKNIYDVSDAGMVYYLLSGGPNGGNEHGGPPETEALFEFAQPPSGNG
ncbi:MAG: hypothetical protein HRT77_16235 [Halioglobus sp.]|nr:hypothetical protein [Halioglobus sp.]